jgi:sulfur carrier protein ThiS
MKLKVLLLPERKLQTVELEKGADGFQLLKGIGLNPEMVIILRADKPIPVDSRIGPNDDLKVVRVVSGG